MKLIGIDLGGTNLRAGLVNGNKIEALAKSEINASGSKKEILELIFKVVDELFHFGKNNKSKSNKDICGIGVGVPGIVDLKKGIVYNVTNIKSWEKVHLKKILEDRYKVSAYINNDANCFAIGEKIFGKAKKYSNAVGLIIGTGMGAGLILNGKLYSGVNCGSGEFGMVSYKDHNYEYYCSGQFFKNVYKSSGEELFRQAEYGNTKAIKIFNEFGNNLGDAIKLILYSFDPQIIILGGSISKAFRFFNRSMWLSISQFEYKVVLKNLKIKVSTINNIAILGAAALYLDAMNT